jgi:hypothetical protein
MRFWTALLLFPLVAVTFGYFLPWWIAYCRNHKNVAAIGALNLLSGWTGAGWIAAMTWAFTV